MTEEYKEIEKDENQNGDDLHKLIIDSRKLYEKEKTILCPFFNAQVTLNADGFNHLLNKPNRQPRNVEEQKLKLRLLKKALKIIKKAGTLQEERLQLEKVGKPGSDGFTKTKNVQYWAFHDIVGEKKRFKIRVILRRVGDGNIAFRSVAPDGKIDKQRLYDGGIGEE